MTASKPNSGTGQVASRLNGGLVVSCQARVDEPLHGPDHTVAMALSALNGGAVGLRVQGLDDIRAVSAAASVPVIGLWKDGSADEVYITPTLAHAVAVADAGADLVAIDATGRPRPDGARVETIVSELHRRGALVVADVSTYDEGRAAADAGADFVATTLSGYTPTSGPADGPDLELVERLAPDLDIPLIAEGRYHCPDQVAAARDRGAWCVVVGTAITRPAMITEGFVAALSGREGRKP